MELLKGFDFKQVILALCLVAAGFVLARLFSRGLNRMLTGRFSEHHIILFQRVVFYGVLILFLMSALRQVGVNLGVLLGAAGILSVALGFASQTSASNLISGLFVIGERAFVVGDVIKVGATTGEVISIDLLSVKLRTFDNLFVRIPNETIIKSEVTTLTKYPIRRIDLLLGVAYKENLDQVRTVLLEVADKYPLCLEEPEPLVIVTGFADSAMTLQFSFYVQRINFLKVRNQMYERIKAAFDAAGIEIPFPHRSLYAGSATEAFPVRLVDSASSQSQGAHSTEQTEQG